MIKQILIILFCFNILLAQEDKNKASELELFLFKIGFDNILKDVEINKEKTTLNEKEIQTINEKIELIMSELYENKRVLLNDSKEKSPVKQTQIDIQKEMQKIRSEIALIKEEINELKNEKEIVSKEVIPNKVVKEKQVPKKEKLGKKAIVKKEDIKIRSKAYPSSKVLKTLKKGTIIYIDKCDKFGWCRLREEEGFIAIQSISMK